MPALTPSLTEDSVQELAAHALGRIGPASKSAVPYLTAMLENGSTSCRACAADAGPDRRRARATVPTLTAALKDDDALV